MKKLTIVLIGIFIITSLNSQYLHREGKRIYDGNNNEIILRGIGIGGWMLQEPYMLGISATNQKDIKNKIKNIIGEERADSFYNAWLNNFVQKRDVDSMAAWGFNSIRLPMHYNLFTLPIQEEPVEGQQTWLSKGFELVDSLLLWCAANKIYLILDLHAAPGGQGKDAAISDYDATLPSLWESNANKDKIVALWKKLAERYKDEEWIGAFDLINEPNWDFENSGNQNGCNCTQNKPLLDLYKRLIDTIRSVDKNHLIIVEGNCWGNNYNGLSSIFSYDENLAVSFHKYWNYNNEGAIQGLLNIRNTYNVPIWCGESGENSNVWYTQAIKLLEKNNIGWAWWTWKKIDSRSGTNSIYSTNEYNTLLNYWKNGGTKPTSDYAFNALKQITNNMLIENCYTNYSVIDAMFRQVQTNTTRPFKEHSIPGYVSAVDYDYGTIGYAYWDVDSANYNVSTGTYTTWNSGYQYRNDGVDIEKCSDNDNKSNGFNVGWTNPNEWLQYTLNITNEGAYNLYLRYAGADAGTKIYFSLDNIDITGIITIPSTGGWQLWKTDTFKNIILPEGTHQLKLHIIEKGCNINYFGFNYSKTSNQIPLNLISASTTKDGKQILINVNKTLNNTIEPIITDWTIKSNNNNLAISSINYLSEKQIIINISSTILYGEKVTLSYDGNNIKDNNDSLLNSISNMEVINNTPVMYYIPAKIEAEKYYQQSGLSVETCNEGGQDMGYTNSGDYLDYLVVINEATMYSITFRIAAQNSGGKLELQLYDDNNNKTTIAIIDIPGTGGWQNWQSVNISSNLPSGFYRLRLYIKNPEFNINWFSIEKSNKALNIDSYNNIKIYPNPCRDYVFIDNLNKLDQKHFVLYDILGQQQQLNFSFFSEQTAKADMTKLKEGIYLMCINTYEKMIIKKIIKTK